MEISKLEEDRRKDMTKIGIFKKSCVGLEVALKHTQRRFRILTNKGKDNGTFQNQT